MFTHCTPVNSASGEVLLGTALIKVLSPEGLELSVKSLIDPCSQSSFISESLCQSLRLKGMKVHAPISGIGGEVVALGKKIGSFKLQPHVSSNYEHQLEALVLPQVSSYTSPSLVIKKKCNHLKGLQLADPQLLNHSHVNALLGSAFYYIIVDGAVIKGAPSEPITIKTMLDWIICGNTIG